MSKTPETPLTQFRPSGVFVTDLSEQLWCEKQLELSFIHGSEETEEMQVGGEIHAQLEEEIVPIIIVRPSTPEDRLAIKLDNLFGRSLQLKQEGITRELPVKGIIAELFVHGKIDELILDDGMTKIVDDKTRKKPTMPGDAQLRTVEFQLMLYHRIMGQIQDRIFKPEQLLSKYSFTKKSRISDNFQKELKCVSHKMEPNLLKLCKLAFSSVQSLPPISDDLCVTYRYQEDKKIIGTHTFKFDDSVFKRNLDFCKEYWYGKRAASPVGESDRWKCEYCKLRDKCGC